MIRTVIVEDVRRSRELLHAILQEHCKQVEVVAMAASVEEGYRSILSERPDLVLLDIEMPKGTGFDLLDRLPKIDFQVIFVTAYDQYALQAIKFCALDYLLKPVDIDDLIHAIRKVEDRMMNHQIHEGFQFLLENLNNRNSSKMNLALPTIDGFEFITIDKIVRCEGDEGYTHLILTDKRKITTTRRLKDLEELLVNHNFFRVHRSHLINLSYLVRYHKGSGGYVEMSDGSSIDVARRKKDEFVQRLERL